MPPAIATEDLSVSFGAIRALDGLTLEVPGGSVFGFLGPNGAGKTTTLRLLLGLLEPSRGSARVLGRDPWRDGEAVRARTGVLLERDGLYERLSGEKNLHFHGRINRLSPDRIARRSRELMERFGLWERRGDPVGVWSRGMRQKLAVCRAFLHEPDLLVLDEPTTGLDAMAAASLRNAITGLVDDEETTVFFTTHRLVEAEELCSLVAIIRDGRLLALDSPDALRNGRGARLQIVGSGFPSDALDVLRRCPGVRGASLDGDVLLVEVDPGTDSGAIVATLEGRGAEVRTVRLREPTLEEAFLEAMEGPA